MAMSLIIKFLAIASAVAGASQAQPQPLRNETAFRNITCEGDNSGGLGLRVGAYLDTCPEAEIVVLSWVGKAIVDDPRMAASLLRLHFHDCFVNGCDASVLLDDTPYMEGEKGAAPNLNSLRGFEVIDAIKSDLEALCPGTVSCADILAIAARDSVMLSRGPVWEAETGRRDGQFASKASANSNLPAPNATLENLAILFQNLGLTPTEMVALSGAHTVGKARCSSFSARLKDNDHDNNNGPDANMAFLASLSQLCDRGDSTTAELDLMTPATFDNQYYTNLLSGEGLLASDQVLVSGGTRDVVALYAQDQDAFFGDFIGSMLKMGRLAVLTDQDGEIRRNCRAVN